MIKETCILTIQYKTRALYHCIFQLSIRLASYKYRTVISRITFKKVDHEAS